MTDLKAIMTAMNTHQRTIRQNIRNLFLVATVDEMRAARGNYADPFTRSCIDEMIAACERHGVKSHGEVPG